MENKTVALEFPVGPLLLECLLCGTKIQHSEPLQKVTDARDLARTLCDVLGIPCMQFEKLLPKFSYCYSCVIRLIGAEHCEEQIKKVESKLRAIKTEFQEEFKKRLFEDFHVTRSSELPESLELKLRKHIVEASTDLRNEPISKHVGVQTDPVLNSEEVQVNSDQSAEIPDFWYTENQSRNDSDYDVYEQDPLDVYHDETTQPEPDLPVIPIQVPSTSSFVVLDGKLPVLKLEKLESGVLASSTVMPIKSLRLRRKILRAKKREFLVKMKAQRKKQVYNPETDQLIQNRKCPHDGCFCYFLDESRLQIHIRRRHEGIVKPEICDICGKGFRFLSILNAHKLIHTGENNFKCSECDKQYKTEKHLKIHRRTHETGQPFACELCPKRFTQRHHLLSHRLSIHEKKPRINCEYPNCKKTYSREREYLVHKKVHEEPESVICEFCQKKFASLYNLRNHVKATHAGQPPIKKKRLVCQIDDCGFEAKFSRDFWKHQDEAHGIDVPIFECKLCLKRLTCQNNLDIHMRAHRNDYKFKCSKCPKEFTASHRRDQHEKIHVTSLDHICDKCGKEFALASYLAHHLKTHLPGGHPNLPARKQYRLNARQREKNAKILETREKLKIDITLDPTVPYFEEDLPTYGPRT